MNLHAVWLNQSKWISVLALVFLLWAYVYQIKTGRSAGYDPNISYAALAALGNSSEGELALLTYNVAGLPEIISAAESPRAQSMGEIGAKINSFDIVNVQEDFHYHEALYERGNTHPFRTLHKEAIPYGDGLNTLSKYPILFTKRVAWTDCHGTDCLAAKGFSVSRIQLSKGITVDVYNVHATSQDSPAAALARRRNIKQLSAYIQTYSAHQALLVMGDFNAHYAAAWDNLHQFVRNNKLHDAWIFTKRAGQLPGAANDFVAQDKLSLTDSCESIDKILFRNSSYLEFTPRSYKIEKQHFSNRDGQSLSDHCAVSLSLKWKKISDSVLLDRPLTAFVEK